LPANCHMFSLIALIPGAGQVNRCLFLPFHNQTVVGVVENTFILLIN
jgi:hypothetical protein